VSSSCHSARGVTTVYVPYNATREHRAEKVRSYTSSIFTKLVLEHEIDTRMEPSLQEDADSFKTRFMFMYLFSQESLNVPASPSFAFVISRYVWLMLSS